VKLVLTFAVRWCRVVSATDPQLQYILNSVLFRSVVVNYEKLAVNFIGYIFIYALKRGAISHSLTNSINPYWQHTFTDDSNKFHHTRDLFPAASTNWRNNCPLDPNLTRSITSMSASGKAVAFCHFLRGSSLRNPLTERIHQRQFSNMPRVVLWKYRAYEGWVKGRTEVDVKYDISEPV
jgi:hypothetical protein